MLHLTVIYWSVVTGYIVQLLLCLHLHEPVHGGGLVLVSWRRRGLLQPGHLVPRQPQPGPRPALQGQLAQRLGQTLRRGLASRASRPGSAHAVGTSQLLCKVISTFCKHFWTSDPVSLSCSWMIVMVWRSGPSAPWRRGWGTGCWCGGCAPCSSRTRWCSAPG